MDRQYVTTSVCVSASGPTLFIFSLSLSALFLCFPEMPWLLPASSPTTVESPDGCRCLKESFAPPSPWCTFRPRAGMPVILCLLPCSPEAGASRVAAALFPSSCEVLHEGCPVSPASDPYCCIWNDEDTEHGRACWPLFLRMCHRTRWLRCRRAARGAEIIPNLSLCLSLQPLAAKCLFFRYPSFMVITM